MYEEKRKFMRFDIPLDVIFKPSTDSDFHTKGTTVNFSRSGLCFQAEKLDFRPNDSIELKVRLPKKDDYISVTGSLAWKEQLDDSSCLAGIKFREIDNEAKSVILDYAYETWLLNFRK